VTGNIIGYYHRVPEDTTLGDNGIFVNSVNCINVIFWHVTIFPHPYDTMLFTRLLQLLIGNIIMYYHQAVKDSTLGANGKFVNSVNGINETNWHVTTFLHPYEVMLFTRL